jgi:hypothetical protein
MKCARRLAVTFLRAKSFGRLERTMKSQNRYKSTGLIAAAILILLPCSTSVAAQGHRRGNPAPSPAPTVFGGFGSPAVQGSEFYADGSIPRAETGPDTSMIVVRMPMESGYGSRPASPTCDRAEEVVEEPRALALPKVEESGLLRFPSDRERYWRPRPGSAIPAGTSSSMFPGSRLRGPFEQTYPRPFHGGGQP